MKEKNYLVRDADGDLYIYHSPSGLPPVKSDGTFRENGIDVLLGKAELFELCDFIAIFNPAIDIPEVTFENSPIEIKSINLIIE